jgi:hypothetical protein
MSEARTYDRRVAVWTRDEVLVAIKRFAERYGRAPTSSDFNPSDCRRSARISATRSRAWLERAERWHEDGDYPYVRSVQRHFDGSWSAAILAAGLRPYRLPFASAPDAPSPTLDVATSETHEQWRAAQRAARRKDGEQLRRHLHGLADAALAWADAIPDPPEA